jgi:transcriptional regulator with XRE-family HTH domain
MFLRIRDLRIDCGKNQDEIADYLGMTQMGYSKYETGRINPPVRVIIALARYYNTSTDYILDLTDEIRPYKRKRRTKERP